MTPDYSYWGIWIVPLGLVLCFWPVLLAWFKDELDSRNNKDKR